MIAHQNIRMDSPTGPLTGLPQRREESLPVAIITEDRLTTVSAIQDVIDRAGKFNSGFARHARQTAGAGRKLQDSQTDPGSPLTPPTTQVAAARIGPASAAGTPARSKVEP